MRDSGLRLLLCTAPEDVAPSLARTLLEARLIGCANLLPGVRALYRWEGEIHDDSETLLLMECVSEHEDAVIAALRAAHPYDVPKILSLDPSAVDEPYLAWLRSVARPS